MVDWDKPIAIGNKPIIRKKVAPGNFAGAVTTGILPMFGRLATRGGVKPGHLSLWPVVSARGSR
jgi:hypothetical protein